MTVKYKFNSIELKNTLLGEDHLKMFNHLFEFCRCSELMKKQKEALDLEVKEVDFLKKQLTFQEEEAARLK